MRCAAVLTVLFALPATLACVSVSTATLTGADLSYPVSLSQSIVDASGNAYKPSAEEKVAHFKRSWTHVQMLWAPIVMEVLVDSAGDPIHKRRLSGYTTLRIVDSAETNRLEYWYE